MARVTLEEFGIKVANFPETARRVIVSALQDSALQGVSIVVSKINSSGITDTGSLANSVSAEMLGEGAILKVDAPHAAIVEYGRRPGSAMPPIEPIKLWAVRKLGIDPSDEEHLDQVAFAIAFSIAVAGIEPRKFFRRSMKRVMALAKRNINAGLARMRL